jgi:hypothetical protein
MDAYAHSPSPVKGRIAAAALVAWIGLLLVGAPQMFKAIDRAGTSSGASEAVVFTSEEGRFRAEFPSEPKRSTVAGKTDEVVFTSTLEDDNVVSAQYLELGGEPKDAEVLLRTIRDDVVAKKGTVRSSETLTAYGHPAMDFAVGSGRDELLGRAVVVSDGEASRLYLIQAATVEEPAVERAYERLIETFTLTG